jgi:hypothetical protein
MCFLVLVKESRRTWKILKRVRRSKPKSDTGRYHN